MLNRRTLIAAAALGAVVMAAPARRTGQIDRGRLDHLDAGFRPVRISAAAVQAEDRHRRESRIARHRPGARHRPARRCRRGVRARQIGGREIPRRGPRREALSGDVQRLRADRAEERPGRHQGHEGRRRRRSRQSRPSRPRSSRAATDPAPMSPNSRSGRRPASTSRRTRAPGTSRSARAWAPRSTPPAPATPTCCPTAAPGSHFKNKGDLAILVEGDKRLFNQYGVMLVNPAKHPNVKKELGQQFID